MDQASWLDCRQCRTRACICGEFNLRACLAMFGAVMAASHTEISFSYWRNFLIFQKFVHASEIFGTIIFMALRIMESASLKLHKITACHESATAHAFAMIPHQNVFLSLGRSIVICPVLHTATTRAASFFLGLTSNPL